jgi:hypothetical protein
MMKFNPLLKVALVPALVWCAFAITSRLSRQATIRQGDSFRRSALEADAKIKYSNALSYKTISSAVDALIAVAISKNKMSLNSHQSLALREKLVASISSHSIGNVDDYVKLILPSADNFNGWPDTEYNNALRQVISDLLANQAGSKLPDSTLEANEINKIEDIRKLARIKRMLFVSAGRSWTNPIFCNKCWSGIALEDMTLRLSTTPFPPTSAFEQAKAEGHHGYKNFKLNKFIKPTLLETLKKHETISFATLSFIVKTEEPIERHRIYMSFYFSPENEDWILEDFICGDPETKFHYEIF